VFSAAFETGGSSFLGMPFSFTMGSIVLPPFFDFLGMFYIVQRGVTIF
jgi:hypothetical protein